MRRRLVTIIAGLSLLLAIVVLIDRLTHLMGYHHSFGYNAARVAGSTRITDHYTLQTSSGLWIFLDVNEQQAAADATPQPTFHHSIVRSAPFNFPSHTFLESLGFRMMSDSPFQLPNGVTFSQQGVVVPSWFLLMILLIVPAMWLRRYLRRIPQRGHCQVCGYDLQASPERCPECGAEIKV